VNIMKCCPFRPAWLAAISCLLLFAATYPPLAYSAVMQEVICLPKLGLWTMLGSRWVLGAGVVCALAGARRAAVALAGLGAGLVLAPLLRALDDALGLLKDPMFEGKVLRDFMELRWGMALPVAGVLVLLLAVVWPCCKSCCKKSPDAVIPGGST
jgi:hypothetical protein